jgi:hypothetical protein
MTYIFIGEYISLIHSLFLISSAYSMYWIQAKTKNKMYTKKKEKIRSGRLYERRKERHL